MKKYSSVLIFLFCVCIVAVLIKIPTGFEGALQFKDAEKCRVLVEEADNSRLIDYYRLNWELILAVAFGVFLIAFAGTTGIRSVFSFAITILVLWKVLVPLYLNGVNPILTGILVVGIMTFVILALVYGFDRQLVGFNRRSA